jgi:uncharacterized protein YlxW (UPF0749 family)
MIDLTQEQKILHRQLELLQKEFSDLFSLKNEMLNYEENFLTALFLDTIGRKRYQVYCLTVDIAMLKQRIKLIQSYLNRNEHPDFSAIDTEITKLFSEYQKKIQREAERLTAANEFLKSGFLSGDETKKLKDAYRVIVKKLHPNINLNLTEYQKDLFVQAQAAYDLCDLNALNEILLSLNLNTNSVTILDPIDLKTYILKLEQNNAILKNQISELNSRFPFSYRAKLSDTKWVEAEQQTLDMEIALLEQEKNKNAEYMLLLQLWKPESLN